jgi:hypothetical protein
MPGTTFTGRKYDCQATILSVGGQDFLGTFTECTLTIEAPEVGVPAAQDTWAQKEQCGPKDWTLTLGTLRTTAAKSFIAMINTGGSVLVSANLDSGETFYCPGIITNASHATGKPNAQNITVTGYGIAPTIT